MLGGSQGTFERPEWIVSSGTSPPFRNNWVQASIHQLQLQLGQHLSDTFNSELYNSQCCNMLVMCSMPVVPIVPLAT